MNSTPIAAARQSLTLPTSSEGFLTETYVDLHRPRPLWPAFRRLETPQGWPVYSDRYPQTILFVFRRRGIVRRIRAKAASANCDLEIEMVPAPRRRKTQTARVRFAFSLGSEGSVNEIVISRLTNELCFLIIDAMVRELRIQSSGANAIHNVCPAAPH